MSGNDSARRQARARPGLRPRTSQWLVHTALITTARAAVITKVASG
ncbi:hypothetical protein [Microbispora sp. GKU 823]|nr:hypothetical protein [Microbispora sp. GKU 823]